MNENKPVNVENSAVAPSLLSGGLEVMIVNIKADLLSTWSSSHDNFSSWFRYTLFRFKKLSQLKFVRLLKLLITDFRLTKCRFEIYHIRFKLNVLLFKFAYTRFSQRYFLCDILWGTDAIKYFIQSFKDRHLITSNV
jgi:hypothetical protein